MSNLPDDVTQEMIDDYFGDDDYEGDEDCDDFMEPDEEFDFEPTPKHQLKAN